MSKQTTATATATLTRISRVGTFSAYVHVSTGDVVQQYSEEGGRGTVFPDFSTLTEDKRPTLTLRIHSSVTRAVFSVLDETEVYEINGARLVFDEQGNSSGAFAGVFKRLSVSGAPDKLVLIGNLAAALGGSSATLVMKAKISAQGVESELSAAVPLMVSRRVGQSQSVRITATDYVIKNATDTLTLTANLYDANLNPLEQTVGRFTFRWLKLETKNGAAEFSPIAGENAATLSVTESMVNGTAIFKVEVSDRGVFFAADTQTVYDFQDALRIDLNPSSGMTTFVEGDTASVTYTPRVLRRGADGADVTVGGVQNFTFAAIGAGMAEPIQLASGTSYTISEQSFKLAGRTYDSLELIVSTTLSL